MQPFVAAEHVKDAYRRYIESSFPIRREALKQRFDDLIENEKLLWQDPFISLSRPFARGATFDELIAEGVLISAIKRGKWGFDRVFRHQADAIRRLSSTSGRPKNTIVATGTGSGKTEAFIVPIVDDCLRNPGPEGVRAVILYPMNALANDQLKRLRRQLAGTGVTFGRYTGDTPQDQDAVAKGRGLPRPPESPEEERYFRAEIQGHPPHILITNYTMLELLLLRKREQRIFHGVKPRFLVLDEVHTYTGILGSEVACLIRRLKEHCRLAEGELACVGTSATVKSSGTDGVGGLLNFATELFAEEFPADAIVEEVYAGPATPSSRKIGPRPRISDATLAAAAPEKPSEIAALFRAWSGADLVGGDSEIPAALHRAIADRNEFLELEKHLLTPRSLDEVLGVMRSWPGRSEATVEELRNELAALFLLGCAATAAGTGAEPEQRFRPKVHLQVRSLASINSCVTCEALLTDGRTECTAATHVGSRPALPLGVCRSCGHDFILGTFQAHHGEEIDGIDDLGARQLTAGSDSDGESELVYLFPGEVSDLALDEDGELPIAAVDYRICTACLFAVPTAPGMTRCTRPGCDGTTRAFAAFLRGARCPMCRGQGRGRHPSIITPLRSGATASVSVLTQSLFSELKAPSPTSDDEKRVLVFADSRQDTAHQAGYLRDRHQTFTQRQLVYRVLRARAERGLPSVALADREGNSVLANEIYLGVREMFGEHDALNFLTPVSARAVEEAGFIDPDRVITNGERRDAVLRLQFDLAIEFTDRADSRNSLEREGLAGVTYPELFATAEMLVASGASAGISDFPFLETLLRAVLDCFRLRRAVDYGPFREYLSAGSDWVRRRIARPTRQTRTPVGFDSDKRNRANAFVIHGIYNRENPHGYRTGIYDLVARACPHLESHHVVELINSIIAVLERRNYLRRSEIGNREAGHRSITASALQLREAVIEVTVDGPRFQCGACRRTWAYQLRPTNGGEAICPAWRCAGRVRAYTPDPEDFYVRLYTRTEPERLYTMEHSGQLSGGERVVLEQKFRDGQVNALVCTPTLELGVDIGDLVALVMRNVPPTPSNYSQRSGRAGRRKRIALVLTHSGQGPHDSYFFGHPEEMITGEIRTPTFLLDNRVVIERHLNSLILEKLATELPHEWPAIRDDEGRLRSDVVEAFTQELARRPDDVHAAVARAFVRERTRGGLPWLDEQFVDARIRGFSDDLRRALELWCVRFRESFDQLRLLRTRTRPTAGEQQREKRLIAALDSLEDTQRHYPLSHLGQVGFLPRYGFPGDMVTVRDWKERQISQAAPVGIVEYAPGNVVYVAGQKLSVTDIVFPLGSQDDVRENADTYRYCTTCSFATKEELAVKCSWCDADLKSGRYIQYEAARARETDAIGQEDEYRERGGYDVATYLRAPGPGSEDGGLKIEDPTGWRVSYSRLREVEIFNRGKRSPTDGSVEPFRVCLECGAWSRRRPAARADDGAIERSHLPGCTVRGWDSEIEPRIEPELHLRASFQGDVVEIELGAAAPGDPEPDPWLATLEQALRLGMQLELFVGPRELGSFVRTVLSDGRPERFLVLYDMMPGGTGYLKRFVEEMPQIVGRALRHLQECDCETACYRCLKEFWNQRSHRLFDKRRVLTALRSLADSRLTPRTLESLSADIRFESFLERRFYALLRERGVDRPTTQRIQRSADGSYIIRADFTYEDRNPKVVVLTDGRAYHASSIDQIVADLRKRNLLEIGGHRLLEFSFDDVVETPTQVIEAVQGALMRSASAPLGGKLEVRSPSESEQTLAAALQTAGMRGQAGGSLRLGPRLALSTAFTAPDRRLAVELIAEEHWVADRDTWVSALRGANAARLAGWRVFRVPLTALGTNALADWTRSIVAAQ